MPDVSGVLKRPEPLPELEGEEGLATCNTWSYAAGLAILHYVCQACTCLSF